MNTREEIERMLELLKTSIERTGLEINAACFLTDRRLRQIGASLRCPINSEEESGPVSKQSISAR